MAAVAAQRTQDTAGTLLPIETQANAATSMDRQVVLVGDIATAAVGKVTTAGEQVTASLDVTASGSLTAATQVVTLVLNGASAASVQITGTWVGTISWEGTTDGTTWVGVNAVAAGQTFPANTTSINGLYRLTPGGLAQVRANMSAFTSGTAVVTARASAGTGGTFVTQVLPTRITDGTTNLPIKAASTAVAATDPSLPVGLHPSSPLPAGANALGSVTVTGSPATKPAASATGTVTTSTPAATSGTLLAANAARLSWKVTNDSNVDVLVSESSAATSATAYSFRLVASGGYYEASGTGLIYTGTVTMLGVAVGTTTATAAGSGACRVTEFS